MLRRRVFRTDAARNGDALILNKVPEKQNAFWEEEEQRSGRVPAEQAGRASEACSDEYALSAHDKTQTKVF